MDNHVLEHRPVSVPSTHPPRTTHFVTETMMDAMTLMNQMVMVLVLVMVLVMVLVLVLVTMNNGDDE